MSGNRILVKNYTLSHLKSEVENGMKKKKKKKERREKERKKEKRVMATTKNRELESACRQR